MRTPSELTHQKLASLAHDYAAGCREIVGAQTDDQVVARLADLDERYAVALRCVAEGDLTAEVWQRVAMLQS